MQDWNGLKTFVPTWLKNIIKPIYQRNLSDETKEKNRLIDTPRFQRGTSQLFNKPFDFVDASTFLYGKDEIVDKEIYRFAADTQSPTIIDCGANIGLSVLYFKNLYPKSRIIAFEPDQKIFDVLKANTLNSGFDNIELHDKAIWVENGSMEFREEGGFSGRLALPGDIENIISVKTQRLKDLLESKVDFLKLDIEGAEYEVLKDCEDVLKNVQCLFIEYHSHVKKEQTLGEILEIVKRSGFRYFIHPAYVTEHPFTDRQLMDNMDLQLNIFALRH